MYFTYFQILIINYKTVYKLYGEPQVDVYRIFKFDIKIQPYVVYIGFTFAMSNSGSLFTGFFG